MENIIASYLIQNKECTLPLIGTFTNVMSPAELDIVNKQIKPSAEEFFFEENTSYTDPHLIRYISYKKNVSLGEAESLLISFCQEWKYKIETGQKFCLKTIGCLEKNVSGSIDFIKENKSEYFIPAPAERVFRENAEHTVLVGDKETTSVVMNEYYKEPIVTKKEPWIIWRLILAAIAFAVLLYHFYNHTSSSSAIGNQNHFYISSPSETYYIPPTY